MIERISAFWLNRLLGIPATTPLTPRDMAATLRVAFCPAPELSPRLHRFTDALRKALMECGVSIVEAAAGDGRKSRFEAGTAVIAPGNFADDNLPINRVSTLYNNLIVGVYDEPPPVHGGQTPQETLDAVIGRLAWEMVHLLIYVTESSWTVCSMNGGITTFETPLPEAQDVLESLIPKLTAQVVPPRDGDLDIRPGALDTGTPEFLKFADDFVECGRIWAGNPRFMNHTSRESLDYRNAFYRKIVSRYLDDRSGMSYGFFARQLPVNVAPAIEADAASLDGMHIVPVTIAGKRLLVPVPGVRIVTTRSGCRKTAIDPRHDLVEIGYEKGRTWLSTPSELPDDLISKPSFDTLTIISHAVGNAMIASILQALAPDSRFPGLLERFGCGMTHWHYYPDEDMIPDGYVVHGFDNPPVSCSTPQSAAYSLLGKLEALERSLEEDGALDYLGDVHIEPGHGTNVVGTRSLAKMAMFLNADCCICSKRGK
jgi:hypothetical protein